MKIVPIPAFYDNYIWLIVNENQQAFCVDPGDAEPVFLYLQQNNLTLTAIILTHHHHDHIGGVAKLSAANPGLDVFGPEDPRIPFVNHPLNNGDELLIDSCRFEIINTPGHTSTHISLYEPKLGWLFCGDTLFSAGCGRVFDGTIEALHKSLQTLKALPDKTKVFCAHEYTQNNLRFASVIEPDNLVIRNYAQQLSMNENACSLPSSIEREKQINPFFRTEVPEVQTYAKHRGCLKNDSLSVFQQIRADKDKF